MQDTKLPLRTWFLAAYLILTTKKGVTSPELARKTGVSLPTAWFLMHRIKRSLARGSDAFLRGVVEVDEAVIGGYGTHRGGRNTDGKHLIVGLVERDANGPGRLVLQQIHDASRASLHGAIHRSVVSHAIVRTDGWRSYLQLSPHRHDRVVLDSKEDASRELPYIHLVFSNLKRLMMGVHGHASKPRIQQYLDVFAHRWNHRDDLGAGLESALRRLTSTTPWPYRARAR